MNTDLVNFKNDSVVTVTTTYALIVHAPNGTRNVGIIQNQGDSDIKIFFSKAQAEAGIGMIISPNVAVDFLDRQPNSAVYAASLGSDCEVYVNYDA